MVYDLGEVINTPGVYRQFISLLQCKNIPIHFSISSSGSDIGLSDSTFYFIVKNIKKTIHVIKKFDWSNPDKHLCINKYNIKKKVKKYNSDSSSSSSSSSSS